jgi:hypothetical protein
MRGGARYRLPLVDRCQAVARLANNEVPWTTSPKVMRAAAGVAVARVAAH